MPNNSHLSEYKRTLSVRVFARARTLSAKHKASDKFWHFAVIYVVLLLRAQMSEKVSRLEPSGYDERASFVDPWQFRCTGSLCWASPDVPFVLNEASVLQAESCGKGQVSRTLERAILFYVDRQGRERDACEARSASAAGT